VALRASASRSIPPVKYRRLDGGPGSRFRAIISLITASCSSSVIPRVANAEIRSSQWDGKDLPGTSTKTESWWERFEDVLLRRMKTQAWPIASEVEAACKASQQSSGTDKGETFASSIEEAQLVEWFLKFKGQRPGLGSSRHTASLIARGILADEREARFYGFSLSPDQAERAKTQRPRLAEWNHHIAVQARLKGISEAEADAIERRTVSPDQLPAAPLPPDAKEFAA
jgi:hypothetical protein